MCDNNQGTDDKPSAVVFVDSVSLYTSIIQVII